MHPRHGGTRCPPPAAGLSPGTHPCIRPYETGSGMGFFLLLLSGELEIAADKKCQSWLWRKTFSLLLGNRPSSGFIHVSSPRSRDGRAGGGPAAGERVLCPCSLSSLSSLIRLTAREVGGLWETVSRRDRGIAMLIEA